MSMLATIFYVLTGRFYARPDVSVKPKLDAIDAEERANESQHLPTRIEWADEGLGYSSEYIDHGLPLYLSNRIARGKEL